MIIEVKAIDLLFFRDGKPFEKGGDMAWAESMLLPNYSTIYGAIRSAYFAENLHEFKYVNTDKDPTLNLVINGIYIYYKNEIRFPLPLDLVYCPKSLKQKKKDEGKGIFEVKKMKSKKIDDCYNSSVIENKIKEFFILNSEGNIEQKENLYLSFSEMQNYFSGKDSVFAEDYITKNIYREDKIGIQKEDFNKSVQESMLYRIEQVRYDNFSLLINFDGIKIKENGFLRLGGQGNSVSYKEYSKDLMIFNINSKLENINRVKIYLMSPAIFNQGWIPDFINKDTLEGVIDKKNVKLVSACVGKSINIGGFDMKNKKQKKLKKAVPPGSIYEFELKEPLSNIEKIIEPIDLDSLNKNEGYGRGYIIYLKE